jgi:hypothetical protein
MEEGQSEPRMSPQRDFPWILAWTLCTGHIPVVQHGCDEPDAACARAAQVPPEEQTTESLRERGLRLFHIT